MKLINLKNKRFGKLIVLEKCQTEKGKSTKWLCKCDCGNITQKFANSLLRGSATSCGCDRFEDLTNKKFGKLTAKKLLVNKKKWLCKCDCGNIIEVYPCNLKSGKSTSCGCFQKEQLKSRVFKHGLRKTKLYSVWANMKQRCLNKKNDHYKNYGGRGIKICKEWLDKENGFMNFYTWAMENGYNENAKFQQCTIDRIDVNGNYEPNNCRWITNKEQALNRTTNEILTYKGESKTIYEWSLETGISSSTISARIKKYHWTTERALTEQPFIGKNQSFKKGGN